MGDRPVHAGLLSLRNPDRHDGRPHRPAPRPHAHRRVVVGLHRPDRRDDRFLPVTAHQVPVRSRRSRRVSECVRGGVAMVPAAPTRHDVRREPDGQPGRRRRRAAAGAADPDAIRLADVVLCVRRGRAGLGGGLVRVVPRLARRKARRRPLAIHRRLEGFRCGPCIPVATRLPVQHRVVDPGAGVLLRLRLQLLSDVVSHVPRPGPGIQRGQLAAFGASVRGRRRRQPRRGRRQRRAGPATRCEARPPSHRRRCADGRGGVHRCGDAHAPSVVDA